MTDPAYIVNDSFRLDFCNKAMTKVFGPGAGKLCHDVLHDRKQPCDDCPWGKIRQGQSVNEATGVPVSGVGGQGKDQGRPTKAPTS